MKEFEIYSGDYSTELPLQYADAGIFAGFIRRIHLLIIIFSLFIVIRPISLQAQDASMIQFIDSLQNVAEKYFDSKDIKEAIEVQNHAKNLIETSLGKHNLKYIEALASLAFIEYFNADYSRVLALCKEGIALASESEDNADNLLISLYKIMGEGNYSLQDFTEALKCYQKGLQLSTQYYGANSQNSISLFIDIAYSYRQIPDYEKGLETIAEALSIYDDNNLVSDMLYAELIEAQGDLYYQKSEIEQAINCYHEALNISEKLEGKTNATYALTMNSLLDCYTEIGKYEEALTLADEMLINIEEIFGKNSTRYIKALITLMKIYEQRGDYPEGIRIGEMALEIIKQSDLESTSEYGQTLNFLGVMHYGIGNYKEALNLAFMTLKAREEILGTESIEYAEAVNNLGIYHYAILKIPEAIDYTKKALLLFEKLRGKKNMGYSTALSNLALYSYMDGNLAEAQNYTEESLKLTEEIYGKENLKYIHDLSLLASIFETQGKLEEAINYNEKAIEILEIILGKQHPTFISILKDLAYLYYLTKQHDKSQSTVIEVTNVISDFIKSNFSRLTAAERKTFWDKNKYWFDHVQSYVLIFMNQEMVENGYNALLTSKGVLLDNEREFSKLIKENENPEIIALFDQWRFLNSQIDSMRESNQSFPKEQLDSMINLSQKLERELVDKSKDFGDYTHNMSLTWKDIKNNLKENEIAIEFVTVPYSTDSLEYAAYVLTPKRQGPGYTPLFEREKLKSISPSQYYTTDTLSKLIWKPLDIYLKEANVVYFSPEGELYNIAIEYLPDYEGEGRMNEKYNIHRLSSSRQLAIPSTEDSIKKAALFGGLQYNASMEVLTRNAEKYSSHNFRDIEFDLDLDDIGLRNGVSNLPGTLAEVQNINASLVSNHISSQIFTDTLGTETSFKNLSGQPIDILHIATHGFYWPETKNQDNFSLLGMSHSESYNAEELALNRSGLLFAGANNILKGEGLPAGTDDGILTAREITSLDFKNIDLVVLSACQTALGEIRGDGVFGLQRGFKKAGVKSLIMSLWKVDDKATRLLMSQFYENLFAGNSRHEALKKAQKYLMEYEYPENSGNHPYNNPRYWAAFILLDAL